MGTASESNIGHLVATLAEMNAMPVVTAQDHDAEPAPGEDKDKMAATPVKTTDSMGSLASEIKRAVSQLEEVVKNGLAPVPYIFGFEPGAGNSDQDHAFYGLLGMASVIRMFAAVNIVATRQTNDRIEPYSLTKPEEYPAAFQEVTDETIKALTTGPLATFYDLSSGGWTQTEDLLLERSQIHRFVLSRVFGGLSQVTQEQLDHDLDHVLTQFVAQMKPFKATPQVDQDTIKHVVLINYVRSTDLTGSGTVFIVDAYTRMVTLEIRIHDWFTALQKPKTGLFKWPEKISFKMTTTVVDMKLNDAKYLANKDRYEQTLKMMVDGYPELQEILDRGGLEAYGRETSHILSASM
ncbi:hypothetical protein F4803DRAFT_541766 [Xylaria telfairii]|nr:hypothetical protein F4803DRAFT_541766 [Xylaria telfairii]